MTETRNSRTVVLASSFVCLLIGLMGGAALTYVWAARTKPPATQEAAEPHEKGAGGEGHEEHGIKLDPEVQKKAGIETAEAIGGIIKTTLSLPGEISLNADAVAHIVPRVSGIVREVKKNLGDAVMAGEVMAVLESRELAEAKAADLAAEARLSLAQKNYARQEELRKKKIVAEQEFLEAQKQLAEAEIEHRTTEAKLHALGLSEELVAGISKEGDANFSRYELRAPFAGTVIEKHMAIGEVISPEHDVFEVADLSTVWVKITVYTQHLPLVRVGQSVTIVAGTGADESTAVIDYVSAVVEEATRTVMARLTLPNADKRWRPGLFVSARVQTSQIPVTVLVPKAALQTINDTTCVFVETNEGFKVRPVMTGRSDGSRVEIADGLKPGERYVSANAFTLKSELEKAAFED